MTDVSDWINLGLLVIAVIAAGFAWWQAAEAKKSRKGAEEALQSAERAASASERQAAAAERALELQEQQIRQPAWQIRHVVGDTYAGINNTTRTLKVEEFQTFPDEAVTRFFRMSGPEDGRYGPGDRFEYMYSRKFPNGPKKLVVRWRFEDEEEVSDFIVPL